jgi:hypothetical protein
MLDALKARRGILRKFSITSFLLFILGLRAGLSRLLLVFKTSFILPMYLGLRLSALFIYIF